MTGQFNWTPTYDQAGDYTIRFGVTDPGGLSDQIDVDGPHRQRRPAADPGRDQPPGRGRPAAELHPAGQRPRPGDGLDLLGGWACPRARRSTRSTGAFSWTPGPAQTGDYVVQFTVSDGQLTATAAVGAPRRRSTPCRRRSSIVLTPSFPAMPGQSVLVHVAASSLAPITGLDADDRRPAGDARQPGPGDLHAPAPGRIAISATATDGDGLVGQSSHGAQGARPERPGRAGRRLQPAARRRAADRRHGDRRHGQRHQPRFLGAGLRPARLVRRSPPWPAATPRSSRRPWPPSTRPRWPTGHTSSA